MKRLHFTRMGLAVTFFAMFAGAAAAQSLDSKAPTPLAPGENHGTVDNQVGPQYWSFKYRKGPAKIIVHFTSMGLFGNPVNTTIQVVLHAVNGKVIQSRAISSAGQVAELVMPGTFGGPGSAILELRPTGSNLVRAGGDYTVTVSGDGIILAGGGATDGATATAEGGRDRVVGTYAVMVCAPDFDCEGSLSIHFAPNGTVQTTDGHSGTWQLFDPDAMIYTVIIGPDRWSLKLVPGRGLFGTNDLQVVVFQAVRPN